jgi:hypothetical protein
MNKIAIKKIRITEIEALQDELQAYVDHIRQFDLRIDFLTAITSLDIIYTLYFILRKRLEQNTEKVTLNLSASQAATILKCCDYSRPGRTEYAKHVLLKLQFNLDQKLKSLI